MNILTRLEKPLYIALTVMTVAMMSYLWVIPGANAATFNSAFATTTNPNPGATGVTLIYQFTVTQDFTEADNTPVVLTLTLDSTKANEYILPTSNSNYEVWVDATGGGTFTKWVASTGGTAGSSLSASLTDEDTSGNSDKVSLAIDPGTDAPNITTNSEISVRVSGVTNPAKIAASGTADQYNTSISYTDGTLTDSGDVVSVILETMSGQAVVDSNLAITLEGYTDTVDPITNRASTASVGTNIASSPALDWGTLTADTAKSAAFKVTVTTNAPNGYVLYIAQESAFQNANGDTINTYKDGAVTDTAAIWASPNPVLGSPDTYGHIGFGVGAGETTTLATTDNTHYIGFPTIGDSTYPTGIEARQVNSPPIDSDSQITFVEFKLEVSAMQEAGTYNNTLIFNVVPSY